MKIQGMEPGVPRGEVTLTWPGRPPLVLELRGLAIGVDDRIREIIPQPTPPSRGLALDPKSRKPLRDPATGKVIPAYDVYDRGYQAAVRKANARRMILMIAEALKGQAKLTFDTPEPDEGAKQAVWEKYADCLEAEFAAYGFAEGHVAQLIKAVMELTNVSPEELEETREAFLSEEPEAETPGGPPSEADEA